MEKYGKVWKSMEKYGSIHVARLTVAIYSILYRLYSRKKYGRTGWAAMGRVNILFLFYFDFILLLILILFHFI